MPVRSERIDVGGDDQPGHLLARPQGEARTRRLPLLPACLDRRKVKLEEAA
jgi:hypothetical protein